MPQSGTLHPFSFKRRATGAEMPFHNSIIRNFMVYQDGRESNLLQLFAYQENSEWFSIIYFTTFEVNIVGEQKKA